MDKDVVKNYKKAQSISDSVVLFSKPLIKEGVPILEIGDKLEEKILSLGGGIAFPVNISINEDAAHYVPDINDDKTLNIGDLVKIDIGVHMDGYIFDQAFTVCVGSKGHPLIDAAEHGLEEAKKLIKPGVKVFEISEVVESTLNDLGFNPVRNLCGHGLERFKPHANLSIPNGRNDIKTELEPGQVIAMEVFATDGAGWVKDSKPTLIFSYIRDKPIRMMEARRILELSKNDYKSLPFAKRWLVNKGIPQYKIDMALSQLVEINSLKEHPVLKEDTNGMVAQAEETLLI